MTTRPLHASRATAPRGLLGVVDRRDRHDAAVSCTREGVSRHIVVGDFSFDGR